MTTVWRRLAVWGRTLAARAVRAIRRRQQRRALRELLRYDDRLLRDIGLTRADVLACLSSPELDPVDVLERRRPVAGGKAQGTVPVEHRLAA